MAVKSLVLLNIFQAFKIGHFDTCLWILGKYKIQMNYYNRVQCSIMVTEFSLHRVHSWAKLKKTTENLGWKNLGELSGHTYDSNSLTIFLYKARLITGNGNDFDLLRIARKNSWNSNKWTYFVADFDHLEPLCNAAAFRRNLRGCFVAGGRP